MFSEMFLAFVTKTLNKKSLIQCNKQVRQTTPWCWQEVLYNGICHPGTSQRQLPRYAPASASQLTLSVGVEWETVLSEDSLANQGISVWWSENRTICWSGVVRCGVSIGDRLLSADWDTQPTGFSCKHNSGITHCTGRPGFERVPQNFNASFTIPSKTLPNKTHIFFFLHKCQMIELESVFGIWLIPPTNIPTKTLKCPSGHNLGRFQ